MITSPTHDIRYPVVGQPLTLSCTISAGNRYRTRLTSAPPGSTIELYSAANANYLADNRFTPDVSGVYRVEYVEETNAVVVPHHSTDFGGADARGVVTTTVESTVTLELAVAGYDTREIGVAPDSCTLGVWATRSSWSGAGDDGVISAYADQAHAPQLYDGRSDNAKIALRDDAVMRALADIGGATRGWTTYSVGDRAPIETEAIIPYADVVDTEILTSFADTAKAINSHIRPPDGMVANQIEVHANSDITNPVTNPACTVGNEPSQRVLLAELLVCITAHAANNGGLYHHDADSVLAGLVFAPPPLPNPSSLTQRIVFANWLFDIIDGHFARKWLTSTSYVHLGGGDQHMDYAAKYPAYDETTVVALANEMRTKYETHRTLLIAVAAPYHNLNGTANVCFNETMPGDRDGFVKAVATLLTVLNRHVTNIDEQGAAAQWHSTADTVCRTDTIPGPTDYVSALNAFEALRHLFAQHVAKGATTHAAAWSAGYWAVRPRGAEAVHHAFRAAVQALTVGLTPPRNFLLAEVWLQRIGGFAKADPPDNIEGGSALSAIGVPIHD